MALLSDREGFDKLATRRAEAAIESFNSPLTIHEACDKMLLDYPVSESDLQTFYSVCETWGVRLNLPYGTGL